MVVSALRFTIIAMGVLCLGLSAQAATLESVRSRGVVQCGVNTGLYGFSIADEKGNWSGLDVDVCRAVAAAVLGDASKVKYVPLTTQQRFIALQMGDVDILARNTTWTLGRDITYGLNFTVPNYYDGQGFMVGKNSAARSARDLNNSRICVLSATTTEQNLTDWFRQNRLSFQPLTFEKADDMAGAFFAGRCEAITSDVSQLAALRAGHSRAEDYQILPDLISKEPLAPAVRQGDEVWFKIVRWSQYAMISAEELGVTSRTVERALGNDDTEIRRLLGVVPGNGKALGLDEKWAYNIIRQVGNYGESFERSLGRGSKLRLERGLNALFLQGGLMYAPPMR